ncbi:hypothetical protein Daus18300_000301 [Diaporthe australafricana]|uniref:Sulfite oxidase n=1 Tax=Diaporthe australafricana TaxID=127596 RepID=A0ABR3Y5Z8_9PEZI
MAREHRRPLAKNGLKTEEEDDDKQTHDLSAPLRQDEERSAYTTINPSGFFIRHPPAPHLLDSPQTPDDRLFQTIHMGAAVVDPSRWRLVVDGMVERPYSLTMAQLRRLRPGTVTAFHECFGSPLQPPTNAVWRIGNVTWSGVPLSTLLALARPKPGAAFVWSEGLDSGTFAGVTADRYQKDLPIDKAWRPEVLVATHMNGEPLTKERGAPARLVVPGWFGTNMTKWLCRLTVMDRRAGGPYTTTFYNVKDPEDPTGTRTKPVWAVDVNSVITRPAPEEDMVGPAVQVEGWAWSEDGVREVHVSSTAGDTWVPAALAVRKDYGWQRFSATLQLEPGKHTVISRATSESGSKQPLSGHRNHVHSLSIIVRNSRET